MRDDGPIRQLPKRTIALVLAGGRGSRLKQLTDRRAKPAVYFGGKFRIIDFALSNCINSGIRRIYVLTQYKSHSLLRHLQRGWGYLRAEMHEFVDLLPAQQRVDEAMWYRGTADAVWQNLDIFEAEGPDHVLILAGDHVYKMDYAAMIEDHVRSGADITVGCVEVPRMEATAFGVMHVNDQWRVTSFLEKPADPPPMPGRPDIALASMGIYVFSMRFLAEQLRRDAADPTSEHDFGKNIVPFLVESGHVRAHRFSESAIPNPSYAEPYWRDVGTIDAYWEANIDLTTVTPALDLYDRDWPIYTYQEQLPPAKFVFEDGAPGRQGGEQHGVRRLHRLRLHRPPVGAVLQGAGQLLRPAARGGGAAGMRHRPPCPADPGGDRPWREDPRRAGGRRGPGARRQALPPHRERHRPDHPADDRRAGLRGVPTSSLHSSFPRKREFFDRFVCPSR